MATETAVIPRRQSVWRQRASETARRLLRNPMALIGLVIILGWAVIAIFGTQLAPWGINQIDLLGLYEGIPLKDRGDYSGAFPDKITIYRLPHLALGLPADALRAEIRRTVLHEIAHHLGIDDARLADLGWD